MSRPFVGSAICEIAKTGAIALPDPFRTTIAARDAREDLYVGLHEHLNCLIAFDGVMLSERIERFACEQVVGSLPGAPAPLDRLRRHFGFAAPARLDGKDRLEIAPWLDEHRGEARHALVVGMGHFFEIWDLAYVLNHGQRDLQQLANLHLDILNTKKLQGASHDVSLQPVRPRGSLGLGEKSGVPVQPLRALQPRHDPIDGIGRR